MGKKKDATYDKILKAAMHSFARFGDKGTTFQSIADLSDVSQPLVARYFKNREAVFPAVIQKCLGYALEKTAAALAKAASPSEMLREYIRVSIRMLREEPDIFKIYLLLHYFAGFDEGFKAQNSAMKDGAINRVARIIQDGIKAGEFRSCPTSITAKVIHCALVGVLISIATEHAKFTDQQLQNNLEKIVFAYLKR